MKKLLALATLVVCAGLAMGACQSNPKNPNAAEQNMSNDMMKFYSALSPAMQKKFDQLDNQHKADAMRMAKQTRDPNKAVETQYNDQMGRMGGSQMGNITPDENNKDSPADGKVSTATSTATTTVQ